MADVRLRILSRRIIAAWRRRNPVIEYRTMHRVIADRFIESLSTQTTSEVEKTLTALRTRVVENTRTSTRLQLLSFAPTWVALLTWFGFKGNLSFQGVQFEMTPCVTELLLLIGATLSLNTIAFSTVAIVLNECIKVSAEKQRFPPSKMYIYLNNADILSDWLKRMRPLSFYYILFMLLISLGLILYMIGLFALTVCVYSYAGFHILTTAGADGISRGVAYYLFAVAAALLAIPLFVHIIPFRQGGKNFPWRTSASNPEEIKELQKRVSRHGRIFYRIAFKRAYAKRPHLYRDMTFRPALGVGAPPVRLWGE